MRRTDQLQRFRSDGNSVSPERLIVLLYERLGRDLRDGAAAIDTGETELRHRALLHAQQIVEELSYAVRPDVWDGGDRLIALYDFVLELLVQGNVAADSAAIHHATVITDGLADAWRQAYIAVAPAPTTTTTPTQ